MATTTNWADEAEMTESKLEDTLEEGLGEMPDRYESEIDDNGIKTVTEYQIDVKSGERVKVTKKVRVVRRDESIKKSVLERRTWTKFGDARTPPKTKKALPENYMTQFSGIGFAQDGVTYHPDAQELDFTPKKKAQMKKKTIVAPIKPVGVWKPRGADREITTSGNATTSDSTSSLGLKSGAYVPPTLRGENGLRRTDLDNIRATRDDTATLRVSNLSDDTREEDLQQLFRPFGPISRTYLAKDRHTHLSRGFAFVNFVRREDAARAMEALAGYGYDHLILQIEWAKPSAN